MYLKSPIPWVGGKGKLLPAIHALAPEGYGSFLDVFGGSGTVVLNHPRKKGCMSLIHTLKELQGRIAAEGITEDNRREIEQKAVRRILLGRESGVSIELINGKVISNQEEAAQ